MSEAEPNEKTQNRVRTGEEFAEEQGVQSAQDGGEHLLLQQGHVAPRRSTPRWQQRPLHPLSTTHTSIATVLVPQLAKPPGGNYDCFCMGWRKRQCPVYALGAHILRKLRA